MDANDNDHQVPQWLTQEYLEKALQKHKNDATLRIENLKIRAAIPKGENYSSSMHRVSAAIEYGKEMKINEQVSYIVKTPHKSDSVIEAMYVPYQVFKTEMDMYESVLPQLSALLKQIGDQDKLFAETIHVDFPNEAIIFEDLKMSKFVVPNRIAGMDVVLAKLALSKLAKMHATAAVLNEKTEDSLKRFTRGIFNRHTRNFDVVFERILEVCAEFAGSCPELGSYYREKILKLIPHAVEYATRSSESKEGQFETLIHGDYWTSNVMVRHDERPRSTNGPSVRDLMIIDFQFCKWTSPAVDLHYFFNTSLESTLRLEGQDELVQFYHQVLSKTLQDLDYKGHIPSLHEFCVQVEDRRFYALISALVSQTFMINDKTEDSDVAALFFDDERGRNFRKLLYTNPVVQSNTKALLPYFDRHGLLDVTD